MPRGLHAAGELPQRLLLPLFIAVSLLAAGLLVFSQTLAFAWDEGFHLLAAQLMKAGKRPFLDFFFPQTPLNAYWNAALMRLFGESWRVAHAAAALWTAGAVWLAAGYVARRFPVPQWKLPAALGVVLLFGLNLEVVEFGTLAQAYGLCLFLSVAAFRFTVVAAGSESPLPAAAAGWCAGAAVGASLLTSSIAPVLLLWLLVYNRGGRRLSKAAAFLAGSVVSLIPVLLLLAKAPGVVVFNIIKFHLLYRTVEWSGATTHNLETLTSWMLSPQALILGLLALAGVAALEDGQWSGALRSEFYLCGWLAAALFLHLSTARPTFARYYLLTVPFLAILATGGLHEAAARLGQTPGAGPDRPARWLVPVLGVLLFLPLARTVYDDRRESLTWRDMEQVARKVDQVTAPGGTLLADESIYFLTRRRPPPGLEHENSQKLSLAGPLAASLHVISRDELRKRIAAGMFETDVTCDDEETTRIKDANIYSQHAELETCTVFWGKTLRPSPAPASR